MRELQEIEVKEWQRVDEELSSPGCAVWRVVFEDGSSGFRFVRDLTVGKGVSL